MFCKLMALSIARLLFLHDNGGILQDICIHFVGNLLLITCGFFLCDTRSDISRTNDSTEFEGEI
jgi:hypothetical protein